MTTVHQGPAAQRALTGGSSPARWAAPWYVHPAEDPAAWTDLAAGRPELAFAVINCSSGPGAARDPYDLDALAARGPATPTLLGYVDTAYGERPAEQVRAEAARWRDWYGIDAVMLDCVTSTPRHGAWDLSVLDALRRDGASLVAANPGVVPHPELLDAADVTCVVETDAATYARHELPAWLLGVPAARQWHLVHGCPADRTGATAQLAARRGAGLVWVTPGVLPDPWSVLPWRVRARQVPALADRAIRA